MVKLEINKFMKATTVYSIAMVNQTLSNRNSVKMKNCSFTMLCYVTILDYIGFMYNVESDLIL